MENKIAELEKRIAELEEKLENVMIYSGGQMYRYENRNKIKWDLVSWF